MDMEQHIPWAMLQDQRSYQGGCMHEVYHEKDKVCIETDVSGVGDA